MPVASSAAWRTTRARWRSRCWPAGPPAGTPRTRVRTWADADPLARFGRPVRASRLPGPLLTRAWDRGLVRAPTGFDVVHSVSLAAPPLPAWRRGRPVVTCHDLAWRRFPQATTRRGRRWHEGALRSASVAGASFVVPSRLVAAHLQADGVEVGRITVIRGGSDHLAPPDEEGTAGLLERLGVVGEYLLSVGTLEPRKNVERMVRAYGVAHEVLAHRGRSWSSDRRGGVRIPTVPRSRRASRSPARCPTACWPVSTGGAGLRLRAALTEGSGSAARSHARPACPPWSRVRSRACGTSATKATCRPDSSTPSTSTTWRGASVAVLTDDLLRSDLVARGRAFVSDRTWDDAARQHVELWRALR